MISFSQIIILGFFLLLPVFDLLLSRSQATLPGRRMQLLRVMFPSWKFFEEVAAVPVLFYRLETEPNKFNQWQEIPQRPKRRALSLLFNPELNYYLACQSLFQQLESDIGDLQLESQVEQLFESVSYQLVLNLVKYEVRSLDSQVSTRCQFKLCRAQSFNRAAQVQDIETFLVSRLHEV